MQKIRQTAEAAFPVPPHVKDHMAAPAPSTLSLSEGNVGLLQTETQPGQPWFLTVLPSPRRVGLLGLSVIKSIHPIHP